MAVTRIKNNQITDSTITAAKIAAGTLTGGLFASDLTLNSNVTITGNLTLQGNVDSISATNTYVNDPLVVFNNGFVGSPSYDIGILVNRNLTSTAPYGSVNAAWIWREADDAFEGLMTTETGATTGSINNSGFANLKVGNITANSLTLTTGTLTATSGITGTPISGSTGYFTTLQGTAFSTANAVISGGYISALTNATITSGAITTLYADSLNTANAVITGGYINSLSNLTATTAQATNFSSGNIYATGTTNGTWSTANVALYEQLTNSTTNASFYVPFYDKATGNASAYTNTSLNFNPSTGALTATEIYGTVMGTTSTANVALYENLTNTTTDATFYPAFYDKATGNAAAFTNTTVNVNPSTGTVSATQFVGGGAGLTDIQATNVVGTVATANVSLYESVTATTTNASFYPFLADKTSGNTGSFTASTLTYNPSTGVLSATSFSGAGAFTTLQATNFSTGNAVISGGYISALTNATVTTGTFTTLNASTATAATLNATAGNITTLAAGSINTANAVITGGYVNGLANLTATTAQATNFSSGNIYATGTTAGTWSTGNVALYEQLTNTTTNATHYVNFYDKATGNAAALTNTALTFNPSTGQLSATTFSGAGAFTTLQATNFSTGNAVISGGYISALTNASITTGTFTTLNASTATAATLNATSGNITTLYGANFSTGNARITGGYADNFPIGANTAATGAFTTLTASGATTLTNTTQATNYQTGALIVSGGVGITKDVYIQGNLYVANLIASTTSELVVSDPMLYLTANALYPYNYDIGIFSQFIGGSGNNYQHSGMVRSSTNTYWGFFSNVITEPSTVINWADGSLIWDPIKAGELTLANTTPSTSTATGALKVSGGAGIAGNLNAGNVTTSMTTGTVMGNVGNFNNLYGTFYGTIAGGAGSANVSLYQALTDATVDSSHYIPMYDKATGNAAAYTDAGLTYNPSTGVLTATTISATNGAITTLNATNLSTGNAVISGGYATLSNVYATTGQFTNVSSGNALITGGSATGLTNFSATTGQVTNFSTGNAVISGGYISALTNATVTTATVTTLNASTATAATLNATAGNVTTLSAQNFSSGNAVITGGSISGLTNLAATTLVVTNFSTGNAVISGGYISALANITATTGSFATSTSETLNATAGNITTLAAGNFSTANAVISGGYISALTNATITTGSITNLTSTTAVATNFSSGNIQATGTTSGTWSTANVALYEQLTNTTTNATHYINFYDKATGNAAALTNTALNFNPSTGLLAATTFSGSGASLTNLPATAVVGTVETANVSLYDSITASTTNATFYPQLVDKATGNAAAYSAAYVTVNPSTNTLSANVFSGAVTATTITASGTIIGSGNIVAAASTESSSTTTGALVVVGGTGIAGNVTAGKAATFNSGKTAGMDFVVKGKTDETLIWARPGSSYDQVVVGNSATTSTLVTGAKLIVNTTDSMMVPVGTTAQRPGSNGGTDTAGMFRYNTTIGAVEWYTGSTWQTASSQFTTITDTQFNGDGLTDAFTSSNFSAATTNSLIVSINGVVQIPTIAYSLSGSTITFTEAPANGDLIDVRVVTTTSTISSLVSTNGFMGFSADNNGVYISTGTSSATVYNYYDTTGGIVSNIANVSVASANTATTLDTISNSVYRSAKYTVQVTNGANYQVAEALVIQNGTTATITTYGVVQTNGNLGVLAATVSGGNTLLQFIATNATNNVRIKKEYMVI